MSEAVEPSKHQSIDELRNAEKLTELKAVMEIICNGMVLPLYFVFWFADWIYAPELKWQFLALRSTVIPLSVIALYIARRTQSVKTAELVTLGYMLGVALPISIMCLWAEGASTPYYAGLNMVAVGGLSFLPLSHRKFFAGIAGIYLPFILGSVLLTPDLVLLKPLFVNSFFMVGTVTICLLIRYFHERLRVSELESKYALQLELANREQIIEQKTEEGVKLKSLSNQFSPQVVHAIKTGQIDVEAKVHRSEICCIFIDIVGSTERVTRIDNGAVDKVIAMFMEDTVKTLLKYDITVDKFLGDGILAFSNDPISYPDYVQRVATAATEIVARIRNRGVEYEDYWLRELEVTVGIAKGYANVGFYGSNQYFKAYTAIGPVVNLASRLCSEAQPNQILVSREVAQDLEGSDMKVSFIGKKNLKGFDRDILKVYELKDSELSAMRSGDVHDCPECASILHLNTNADGLYEFSCRDCGYVLGDNTQLERALKKAV